MGPDLETQNPVISFARMAEWSKAVDLSPTISGFITLLRAFSKTCVKSRKK